MISQERDHAFLKFAGMRELIMMSKQCYKIFNAVNMYMYKLVIVVFYTFFMNITTHAKNIENNDISIDANIHFISNVNSEEWDGLEKESANYTLIVGEIAVLEDGSTRGTVKTFTKGSEAEAMQKLFVEMHNLGASNVAAHMLRKQNLEGQATLKDIKSPHHQYAAVEAVFTLSNRIEKDGSYRIPLNSGIRVVQMPQTRYLKALREKDKPDDLCKPRYFEQKIVFTLPKKNLVSIENDNLPEIMNVEIQNSMFRAKYNFQDDKLFLHRQFYIKSLEDHCTDEAIAENILVIRAAAREFNRALTLSPIRQ